MVNTVIDQMEAKRFRVGIEAKKDLLSLARNIQDRLLRNLPSNYPKDRNTNLGEFFRAVALEFARLQTSASDIANDQTHDTTRVDYLYQILGDLLFLGEKAINEAYSDIQYREYLIRIRNAYFGGSRKDNIQSAVSDLLGIPVTVKEIYLDLRKDFSFYTIKDTHKMFFDIFMDQVSASYGSQIGSLLEDIHFFIDMIKPAHVLYDTRLIWTDSIARENTCTPEYITSDMPYEVYGTSRIDMVTYKASKVYKFSGIDTDETWTEGQIASIDKTRGIIHLEDDRLLVYDSSTLFYIRDPYDVDHEATIDDFEVGDIIKYYAEKDSATTSDVIEDDWTYTGIIADIDESRMTITLGTGEILVCNTDTLIYTRDTQGEYRIEIDDLLIDHEIVFKAKKYTQQFEFYTVPEEVQDDFFQQFNDQVIEKPTFQENVKKEKDIPEGTTEGWDVVIVDGVATVKKIQSKFYKRADKRPEREQKVDRYNLSIDHNDGEGLTYEDQFSIYDPTRPLTKTESTQIFIDSYGYTGLLDPEAVYDIQTQHTAKLTDNGSRAQVEAIDDHTELCERKASCQLQPFYEDLRKYFTWPDVQLTSGFFDVYYPFLLPPVVPGQDDLPAYYYISSDPNTYTMPLLPMLDRDGALATISTITVYVSGRLVENAVDSVDPWNGIVSLNFIPPFDTKIRIDYYYANRYPKPIYQTFQNYPYGDPPIPNDLYGQFTVIDTSPGVRKLSWPFVVVDETLYGDDYDYQMNKFPILNEKGELASKTDISVSVGTVLAQGTSSVYGVIPGQGTLIKSLDASWASVQDGDTVILTVENYLDNTLIYTIVHYDSLNGTILLNSVMPDLASVYPTTVVHFNTVAGAVEAVRPLLGHVRVNFIPPVNTIVRFDYCYTYYQRNYLFLPDDASKSDPFWDYGSTQYLPDTYYGPWSNYTLLPDAPIASVNEPIWTFEKLMKMGYRYRMFDLSSSAVLNSETFLLNDYGMYGKRGSFKSRDGLLNQYNLMFSPEYLTDTDKNIILNDMYLEKDIPPMTVLNPGTPLFVKTFTDDTHFVPGVHADEHDTYEGSFMGGLDVGGGFSIIEPDDSGLIDYNPVCSYEDNKEIDLYSDLKFVEKPDGDFDAPLSPIDDSGSSLPFKTTYIEQYYPNRELRLNDYMDYINQVPTEYRTGDLRVLNGSAVVKSIEGVFLSLHVGDTFTVKNVPFLESDFYTHEPEIVYRDLDYILVEIIDFETGRIHSPFKGPSGQYSYTLVSNKVYKTDVYLNEVQRTLVLNGEIGYTYGISDSVLMALPGYGVSGMDCKFYFRDPDPDPYPSNPDNPWIGNPTGIVYYPITSYTVDGKEYLQNRTLGMTGMVLTSQIVDAEGRSFGYTGGYAGVTGPSGALDLGITGPTEYANPRTIDPYDIYVIPSGATGTFISYSEAEYRVQWRNWDQEIFLVYIGQNGVLKEPPFNLMDDVGEGIKRFYWDVAGVTLKEIYYHGTLIESSEMSVASVPAALYTNGLIPLDREDVERIQEATDPVSELPDLHLGDTNYQLNRRIEREILRDNSLRVTEIQEFVPIGG